MNPRSFVLMFAGVLSLLLILWLIISPGHVERYHAWYRIRGNPPTVALDHSQAAVLPITAGRDLPFCSRHSPTNIVEFWSPDSAQVGALERDLASFLPVAERLEPWRSAMRPPLHTYWRQYLGFVEAGGRHLILVNSFASFEDLWYTKDSRVAWQLHLANVCDGGTDYWSVEYDPEARAFRAFTHDGTA